MKLQECRTIEEVKSVRSAIALKNAADYILKNHLHRKPTPEQSQKKQLKIMDARNARKSRRIAKCNIGARRKADGATPPAIGGPTPHGLRSALPTKVQRQFADASTAVPDVYVQPDGNYCA